MANTKIKTSAIAAFIDIGDSSTSPKWARVRKQGELKLKYDGETEEDKWVDENTPSTSLEKYAVSFEGELTCYNDDELFKYLDALRQNRATGTDAETQCLVVYKYDTTDKAKYAAELNRCTLQFSEFGGEGGGGSASLNYTCSFNGDPTLGTASFTGAAPTFTANSATE